MGTTMFGDPIVTPARGPVFGLPPSRSKMRAEERADRGEARSDMTAGVSVADTAHDNRTQDINNRLGNPQALRKEYAALPEVRAYGIAAQQLTQALNTGRGTQADLALTYAFAKAMDPESVVRDQEQNMVIESQPWFQASVERVRKQFGMDGAGNFTDEARAGLRQQIIRSVKTRRQLYELQRRNFAENASRNGIDPVEVIGPHVGEAFRNDARAYDNKRIAAGATVGNRGPGTAIGATMGRGLTPPPRRIPRKPAEVLGDVNSAVGKALNDAELLAKYGVRDG